MTIREHFQRVFNRIKYGSVGGVLAVVLAPDFAGYHLTRRQDVVFGLLLGIPFVLVVLLLTRRRFLCPRCGTDLQKLVQQQLRAERRSWLKFDGRMFYERWDACPHCGVSFSEPYPG